jgi:hypothetical protein
MMNTKNLQLTSQLWRTRWPHMQPVLLQKTVAAALHVLWSESQMLAQASGVNDNPCRLIEAELKHIKQQQDRGRIMRTVEANQDQGDVIQRYRRIESLFRQLHVSIRPFIFNSCI